MPFKRLLRTNPKGAFFPFPTLAFLHRRKCISYAVFQYNYQYDGSCGIYTTTVAAGEKTCAIYQVKGLTSAAERIEAVGIGVDSTDMSGTVYQFRYANGAVTPF